MPPRLGDDHVDDLVTLRDWLRFAVSRFSAAQLTYGHGTQNATDESAVIILSSLDLPIDSLDPWLDCRLTRAERQKIANLIAARIETRKPAPYLINAAWIQGRRFYVDERVIVPRSFIGELLCTGQLYAAVGDADSIANVLELCTGSGCLAILAAEAFPEAKILATDISTDALDVARRNVSDYGLDDCIALMTSDLFAAIPPAKYHLILANPPYVKAASVAAFPAEYKAEPQLAHLGGSDGLDLVHRILDAAPRFLAPNGTIVVEIGQARDALETARPDLPFLWLDTETSEGEVFVLQAKDFKPETR